MLAVAGVGCSSAPDAQALEEQRQQQRALNTRLLGECLGLFVDADNDSLQTDEMLRDYYADSTHTCLWVNDLMPTAESDSLLATLQREARRAGFPPAAFGLDTIAADIDSLHRVSTDSLCPRHIGQLARVEYLLSKAYLRFVKGQRHGFVDNPENLLNKNEYVHNASEQHIKPLPSSFADEAISHARDGQAIAYVLQSRPTSALYQRYEQQLPVATDTLTRRRLMANMERERWHHANRPSASDAKYVLVNAAAQQLWAVGPDTVLQMRVVCGARRSKTPLMRCTIGSVEVNPEWHIPPKLVRDEVSAHAGNAAYFERLHYVILNSKGDTVPPESVTREQMAANHFRVNQLRGPGNALGRLKFNISNPFSVYLHDTNQKGAFSRADRALSHGCVRVQKPYELACFVLGLNEVDHEATLDQLRVAIGMTPTTEKEQQFLADHADDPAAILNHAGRWRGVPGNVPVYIIYNTLYPSPVDDKMETWGDPYGFDALLLKAMTPYLQTPAPALPPSP